MPLEIRQKFKVLIGKVFSILLLVDYFRRAALDILITGGRQKVARTIYRKKD